MRLITKYKDFKSDGSSVKPKEEEKPEQKSDSDQKPNRKSDRTPQQKPAAALIPDWKTY